MAKLNERQKLFVVQHLACFETPTEVAEAVKEEFGIEVPRQQVAPYATSRAWKTHFESARKRFLEQIDEVPLAKPAVRVKRLAEMAEKARARGNYPLAAQLMEQIAKEKGGLYTNKREVQGNLTLEQLLRQAAADDGDDIAA